MMDAGRVVAIFSVFACLTDIMDDNFFVCDEKVPDTRAISALSMYGHTESIKSRQLNQYLYRTVTASMAVMVVCMCV